MIIMSKKATSMRKPEFKRSWTEDNVKSLVYDIYGTEEVYILPEGDRMIKGKKSNTLIDVVMVDRKSYCLEVIYENVRDLPYSFSENSKSLIEVEVEGQIISVEIVISTFGKYVSIEHDSDLDLFFVFSSEERTVESVF